LPALAWIALDVYLRVRTREPEALSRAMAEDEASAKRLGLLARAASWIFFAWMIFHAIWLWLPKLSGAEPLDAWIALRTGMGTWPIAIANGVGLCAFAIHLWGALPRLFIALGWIDSPESRRGARLSGFAIGVFFLVLYAQLAGFHAAGRGTIWPLS
jgi:hypothetical protein